ncbi:MAG: cupin domain-containing protein [Chloroflexaceae bacterium]|nr:cupin domain-containing protein [Chloroflexaceae bacterium]
MTPLQTQPYRFTDDGTIPNNARLPLLVYAQALPPEAIDSAGCTAFLARNGWHGAWTDGVFPYHHYHSTAHEVLAVISGNATLHLGGEEGTMLSVQTGDVLVIPAGVGHRNHDSSNDFKVVGAYPDEQEWDLCTGKPEERPGVLDNIRQVVLPATDPLSGRRSPLLDQWQG